MDFFLEADTGNELFILLNTVQNNTHKGSIGLTLVLDFTYIILFGICSFQIGRIIYYRHSLQSFHFGFLLLALLGTVLRICFFTPWPVNFPALLGTALLWFPTDVQFAMYSLLLVFYKYMVSTHRRTWDETKNRVFMIFWICNLVSFSGTCSIIHFAYAPDGTNSTNSTSVNSFWTDAHAYQTVFLLLILVLFFAYYVWQVIFTEQQNYGSYITGLTRESLLIFTAVTSLSLSSRCFYNMGVLADWWAALTINPIHPNHPNDDGNAKLVNLQMLLLLFWWEILPTLAVLWLIRHIPQTRVHYPCFCYCFLCCLRERAANPNDNDRDSEAGFDTNAFTPAFSNTPTSGTLPRVDDRSPWG
jgi:hypothetical protein